MKKLELYTGQKTYMLMNGEMGTPERLQKDFPAILTFAHVIETDEYGECAMAVMNLSVLRGMHDIDKSASNTQAIAQLEEIMNKPQETFVSNEERIAAALEFQNVLNM